MFNDRLKRLREARGLSRQQVSDMLDIKSRTYVSYENNEREPNSEILIKLSEFFGVSVDYLLGVSTSFDFFPHDICDSWEDDDKVKCPICDDAYGVHYVKSIDVDFKNEKSNGIAIEFSCKCGHIFYYLFESYKGYTFAIQTDGSTVEKIKKINFENAPVNLKELNLSEKYEKLDEHGRDMVDTVLDKEYNRCELEPDKTEETETEIITINYIKAPVSAGLGDMLNDYEDMEKIKVPLTRESRKADFVLRVHGDSMESKFYDGDYILVRQQPVVDAGQIGIFAVNGEGYVKKMGTNMLISLNSDYPNVELNENTDFKCFGLVLGTTEIIEE